MVSRKELELISHRQNFTVSKYKNNRIKTVNNTITADNIAGSDSQIQYHQKIFPNKYFKSIIASINSEKIYYHNLTLIVRKLLNFYWNWFEQQNHNSTNNQTDNLVSLDSRTKNKSNLTVPNCSTILLKITISQLQSPTKLNKTTNGFKQSSNCPAIQLTFFWQSLLTLLSHMVLVVSYFYR